MDKKKIWEEILANPGYSRTVNNNKIKNKEKTEKDLDIHLETEATI